MKITNRRDLSTVHFRTSFKRCSKHFVHEEDVLLLTINPAVVKAEIKYELASNGQKYPHVYGAINIDAIIDVVPFPKEKGEFILPELQR